MPTPGFYPITVVRGADWSDVWTLYDQGGNPWPLQGYTALLSVGFTGQTPVLTMTDTSGLTLGGSAGTVAPHLTAAQTALLPRGEYPYTFFVTSPGGFTYPPLSGAVYVL